MAARWRSLLGRPPVAKEVDDELAFHLEMRTRDLMAAGLSEAEAGERARERFGDVERVRRECLRVAEARERDVRSRERLEELLQDLRFAARQMRRAPGFTAVAVVTLALGIGATTALFAALHAVVLRRLPYPDAARLVYMHTTWGQGNAAVSVGNFLFIRDRARFFDGLAAVRYSNVSLVEGDAPERLPAARVTHEFFRVLGLPAARGRTFAPSEDAPGSEHVAVLSHRLWQRRFAADPAIVGRRIRLDGAAHEVVGVMPPAFDLTAGSEELWLPIAFTPEQRAMYDEHYLVVYGRLRPDASREVATADLAGVASALRREHPVENSDRGIAIRPFLDTLVEGHRERLLVLFGAVGLVLLVACANVAGLLLARGAARARELTVRAALGAGRGRIARQLLAETLALATVGTLAGVVLSAAFLRLLIAGAPEDVPRLEQARLDVPVLAFAAALGLLASLLAGLVPALSASRADLRTGLVGRSVVGRPGRDVSRRALVVAQVALSLVLVAGAGLLLRASLKLGRLDLGFDPRGLLSARVALPREGYEGPDRPARAFEELLRRTRSLPGVREAALSSQAPLVPGGGTNGLVPEGRSLDVRSAINSRLQIVTPGYFEALGIRLVRGRGLTESDRRGSPLVMVVSETLARTAWPGQDPIGKRVVCCEGSPTDPRWKEVIGVAADLRSQGPAEPPVPEFYLPMDQVPPQAWGWIQRRMTVVARVEGIQPGLLASPLRQALREVDPGVPLYDVATMEERHAGTLGEARFHAGLVILVGAIAGLLAAVGLYGVVAYFVTQRSREIGVRIALGASGHAIVRMVAAQGARLVLPGALLGIGGALAAGRVLASVLPGVPGFDLASLALAAATLLVSAVVASALPARRAVRVDPAGVLGEG